MIDIMDTKKTITVQAVINAPVDKVWNLWTTPGHITKWNNASDDWHAHRQKMIYGWVKNFFTEWRQKMAALALTLSVYMTK